MDTRLGNYGENLRKINKTLFDPHSQSKSKSNSPQQTTFSQCIDDINLDDSTDDPINRSRSCDETSFFEVLDEVNGSIAHLPEKFVVGSNKRVQIVAKPTINTDGNRNAPRFNISTPAASKSQKKSTANASPQFSKETDGRANPAHAKSINRDTRDASVRPNSLQLKVANNLQATNDVDSFYVTPFAPDQKEEEVKQYVMDIANAAPALVNVTKLVPRGKNAEDLSFVSFKVTICKSVSSAVGDCWYWPDGVTVREFEPNPKNGSFPRLPIAQ